MNSIERSLVCLYSDPNFLAVNILENLLSNNCFVNVITENIKGWRDKTKNIAATSRFSIIAYGTLRKDIACNYIISCAGFIDKTKSWIDIEKFLKNTNTYGKKTLLIVPREAYGALSSRRLNLTDNIGTIYVGDLLGPRLDLDSNLKISNYLNEIINNRTYTVPVGDLLYPIFVNDAARQIVKWLFAFGPYGREVSLIGPDTSANVFWQANAKLIGDIKIKSINSCAEIELPESIENYRINRDLGFLLTETYKWISKNPSHYQETQKVVSKKITVETKKLVNTNKAPRRKLRILWTTILIILLFPLFAGIVSAGLSYLSFLQFRSGHDQVAHALLYIVKAISAPSRLESSYLKHVPLIGQVYKETEYASDTFSKVSVIGANSIPLIRTGEELISNVLSKNPYSVSTVLAGFQEGTQRIYNELSDFEERSIKSKNKGSLLAGLVLSKINIGTYRQLTSQMVVMTGKLPEVLGEEKSKTYLILFENNMELRPTGGFIGSYGLLTFDKGRLSDFTISDIYSADGQLNGHVEPPAPIKNYLNEANWWFRDSNWDPDFPTSAKRAEWFLNKEMDKEVDGVVSIDLYPIKNFLDISGPVFLSDYNMEINSSNLYERVQSEVQDGFFPGTHKKASFLTALSRGSLEKIGGLSSPQKFSAMRLAYESLNERHIQIFLHDSDFQRSINNLGWDGSVFIPVCSGACYSDLLGIVEANVGCNKSNYFIKRSADIVVKIEDGQANRNIILTLQNSANTELGISGRYKSYIRLLVPQDVTDIEVESSIGQNTQILTPEVTDAKGRKEIGILIEVLAGETKKISFSWSGKIDKSIAQYNLYFRKQAGVDGYPVSITLYPSTKILASNPTFTLTDGGGYLYNTTLVRDLFAKLSL